MVLGTFLQGGFGLDFHERKATDHSMYGMRDKIRCNPAGKMFMLSLLGLACLFLRPHGDTFTALDPSGYRLMSYAFSQGRGLHETDQALLELPLEIRNSVLLVPYDSSRNTRDRSFRTISMKTADTEPFFYPLVPLLSSTLEKVVPGLGRDYLMPVFGMVFCYVLLRLGRCAGGSWGMAAALVFCLGSPLPLWLFRGFNLAAAGAAFLGLSVLVWWRMPHRLFVIGLFAGLAALLHPVYIVLGPLWIAFILLLTDVPKKDAITGVLGVGVGVLALFAMTQWMAAPYGTFDISKIIEDVKISRIHQLILVGAFCSALALICGVFSKKIPDRFAERIQVPSKRFFVSCFCLLPLALSLLFPEPRILLLTGLWEFWLAIRWPMGVFVILGIWFLHSSREPSKSFAIWMLFLLTLPLFMYLKGAEQMGMWSQRRLFPSYTLLALSLIPVVGESFQRMASCKNPLFLKTLCLGLILVSAGSNFVRWPAPYLLQKEKGALAEMEKIKERIGHRMAVFDYQPYSFPFAVDNRARILGLAEASTDKIAPLARWVAEKATGEEVLWVSGYRNPGLEINQQLILEEEHIFEVDRLRSKAALPAVSTTSEISMRFLRVDSTKLDSEDLMVKKVFDGGPLALRPPWANSKRVVQHEGRKYPADWSRQNSGIVGPLPLEGGGVKITIWAKSGQNVPQKLRIRPPWRSKLFKLDIPVGFQKTTLVIPKPESLQFENSTGIYRISSPTPYDPSQQNIHGFPHDLGVLIHQMKIERVPLSDGIGN